MSTFNVDIVELEIHPHENADKLEVARIGGYTCIVGKGDYTSGDKAVYIPEQAILPDDVIEYLGLTGRLSGKAKNRVKAIKLRGVLSQGLLHPLTVGRLQGKIFSTGDDFQSMLGITKYVPQIPESMGGDVKNSLGLTINYDIENFKRDPMLIAPGIEMVATEKIHGTWCCFGITEDIADTVVTSKGISAKHLSFKLDEGTNASNLYVRKWKEFEDLLRQSALWKPFYVLGEIYGQGVQDLTYDVEGKDFRVFDIYLGYPGAGKYLSWDALVSFCNKIGMKHVPEVEKFTMPDTLEERNDMFQEISVRNSLVGGAMMEGVVIRPVGDDRYSDMGNRWIQKYVSDRYLLRKGDVTEFE